LGGHNGVASVPINSASVPRGKAVNGGSPRGGGKSANADSANTSGVDAAQSGNCGNTNTPGVDAAQSGSCGNTTEAGAVNTTISSWCSDTVNTTVGNRNRLSDRNWHVNTNGYWNPDLVGDSNLVGDTYGLWHGNLNGDVDHTCDRDGHLNVHLNGNGNTYGDLHKLLNRVRTVNLEWDFVRLRNRAGHRDGNLDILGNTDGVWLGNLDRDRDLHGVGFLDGYPHRHLKRDLVRNRDGDLNRVCDFFPDSVGTRNRHFDKDLNGDRNLNGSLYNDLDRNLNCVTHRGCNLDGNTDNALNGDTHLHADGTGHSDPDLDGNGDGDLDLNGVWDLNRDGNLNVVRDSNLDWNGDAVRLSNRDRYLDRDWNLVRLCNRHRDGGAWNLDGATINGCTCTDNATDATAVDATDGRGDNATDATAVDATVATVETTEAKATDSDTTDVNGVQATDSAATIDNTTVKSTDNSASAQQTVTSYATPVDVAEVGSPVNVAEVGGTEICCIEGFSRAGTFTGQNLGRGGDRRADEERRFHIVYESKRNSSRS